MQQQFPLTAWRERVFGQIDGYLKVLGWPEEEARSYVAAMFGGRISRHQLSDQELTSLEHKLDWAAANQNNPKQANGSPN
jgi:hypothetical protein